jgi:hypothetical protein
MKHEDIDHTGLTGVGGLSDPMTTRGDIIVRNASNVTARLGRGSASQVLTSDGTDVAWAAAGKDGAAMTLTEATLGADVTMATANTFYDGPTLTPAAGTYDVTAYVSLQNTSANTEFFTARLVTVTTVPVTTVVDEREIDTPILATLILVIPLAARVVLNGTTVIKVTAAANARTNQKMMRDPLNNSSGLHRATLLRIQKVA